MNILFIAVTTVHTLFGLNLTLARRRIKGRLINTVLVTAGIVAIGGFTVISLI